jgi:signal recognition particle subunit SRP54
MFENLRQNLTEAIQTLRGQGKITEINVASTVKEIRKALIQADVNYKIAKQITDDIKTNALGKNVLTSLSPGQLFTKVISDELTKIMGSEQATLNLSQNPSIILMAGLQGSGKTTFSAKLANYLKHQNKKVLLVACDVYRPAAIDQLKVLGAQIAIDVFSKPDSTDVLQIAKEAIDYAKANNQQIIIIDTAGRQTVDTVMMREIKVLQDFTKPTETLLVVDAMTGQDAVSTAKAFHDQLNLGGIVLTKLDGDTRGGAALSIRAVVDRPIKFIGIGEKLTDLDIFYPDRMAKRILGMGDIVSFVEQIEKVYDEEQISKLNKKLKKNQFDLNDFMEQIQQIKKMGGVQTILSMMPAGIVNNHNSDTITHLQDQDFESFTIAIQSMTPKERTNPHILDLNRKTRIAQGSGTSMQTINKLLKQYDLLIKMTKKTSASKMKDILQLFQNNK